MLETLVRWFLVLILASSSALAIGAAATTSSLDRAFNGTGVATTSLASYHFNALAALQSDGKIVTAGTVGFEGVGVDLYFGLTRHDAGGMLDASFGAGGILVDRQSPFGTLLVGPKLNDLAIQSDGKILVAGSASIGVHEQFLLVRYNSDGSRDSSFGANGVVVTSLNPYEAQISSVALQPDGYIVVAGQALSIVVNGDDGVFFAVARYTPAGALDPTFGSGGVTVTAFDLKASANALALQHDGKILVAGYTRTSGIAVSSVALARYTGNGALDPTFGTNGRVTSHPGVADVYFDAVDIALQGNDSFVIATSPGFSLLRFRPNGDVDASFGSQGLATSLFAPFAAVRAVTSQPDGRIIAAGYAGDKPAFAVARFTSSGALDSSFGVGGVIATEIGSASSASSVVLQDDGKIVVAGVGDGGSAFALARYIVAGVDEVAVPALSTIGVAVLCVMMAGIAELLRRRGRKR